MAQVLKPGPSRAQPAPAQDDEEFIVTFDDDEEEQDEIPVVPLPAPADVRRAVSTAAAPQHLTATIEELRRRIAEKEMAAKGLASANGDAKAGGKRATPTGSNQSGSAVGASLARPASATPNSAQGTSKRAAQAHANAAGLKRRASVPKPGASLGAQQGDTAAKNKQSAMLFLQSIGLGSPSAGAKLPSPKPAGAGSGSQPAAVGSAVLRRVASAAASPAAPQAASRAQHSSPTGVATARAVTHRAAARVAASAVQQATLAAAGSPAKATVRASVRTMASPDAVSTVQVTGAAARSVSASGPAAPSQPTRLQTANTANGNSSPTSALPATAKASLARPATPAGPSPLQKAAQQNATAAAQPVAKALPAPARQRHGDASAAGAAHAAAAAGVAASAAGDALVPDGRLDLALQACPDVAQVPPAGPVEAMGHVERQCRARLDYLEIKWQILKEQEARVQTEWNEVAAMLQQELGADMDAEPALELPLRRPTLRPGSLVEQRRAQLAAIRKGWEGLLEPGADLPLAAAAADAAGPAADASEPASLKAHATKRSLDPPAGTSAARQAAGKKQRVAAAEPAAAGDAAPASRPATARTASPQESKSAGVERDTGKVRGASDVAEGKSGGSRARGDEKGRGSRKGVDVSGRGSRDKARRGASRSRSRSRSGGRSSRQHRSRSRSRSRSRGGGRSTRPRSRSRSRSPARRQQRHARSRSRSADKGSRDRRTARSPARAEPRSQPHSSGQRTQREGDGGRASKDTSKPQGSDGAASARVKAVADSPAGAAAQAPKSPQPAASNANRPPTTATTEGKPSEAEAPAPAAAGAASTAPTVATPAAAAKQAAKPASVVDAKGTNTAPGKAGTGQGAQPAAGPAKGAEGSAAGKQAAAAASQGTAKAQSQAAVAPPAAKPAAQPAAEPKASGAAVLPAAASSGGQAPAAARPSEQASKGFGSSTLLGSLTGMLANPKTAATGAAAAAPAAARPADLAQEAARLAMKIARMPSAPSPPPPAPAQPAPQPGLPQSLGAARAPLPPPPQQSLAGVFPALSASATAAAAPVQGQSLMQSILQGLPIQMPNPPPIPPLPHDEGHPPPLPPMPPSREAALTEAPPPPPPPPLPPHGPMRRFSSGPAPPLPPLPPSQPDAPDRSGAPLAGQRSPHGALRRQETSDGTADMELSSDDERPPAPPARAEAAVAKGTQPQQLQMSPQQPQLPHKPQQQSQKPPQQQPQKSPQQQPRSQSQQPQKPPQQVRQQQAAPRAPTAAQKQADASATAAPAAAARAEPAAPATAARQAAVKPQQPAAAPAPATAASTRAASSGVAGPAAGPAASAAANTATVTDRQTGTAAATAPNNDASYQSPLAALRSYRLSDAYAALGRAHLPDTTALDASWPICRFDVRGSCRDMRCPMQHLQDGVLQQPNEDMTVRKQAVSALGDGASMSRVAQACAQAPRVLALRFQGRAAHIGAEARVRSALEPDPTAPKSEGASSPGFSSTLLRVSATPAFHHPTLTWTAHLASAQWFRRDDRLSRHPLSHTLLPPPPILPSAGATTAGVAKTQGTTTTAPLPSVVSRVHPSAAVNRIRTIADARQNRYFTESGVAAGTEVTEGEGGVSAVSLQGAGNTTTTTSDARIDTEYERHRAQHGHRADFWLQWACEHLGMGNIITTHADHKKALDVLIVGIDLLTREAGGKDLCAGVGLLLTLGLSLAAAQGSPSRATAQGSSETSSFPPPATLNQWTSLAIKYLQQADVVPAVAYRLALALARHGTTLEQRVMHLASGVLAAARKSASSSTTAPATALGQTSDALLSQDQAAYCADLGLHILQTLVDEGSPVTASIWANCVLSGQTTFPELASNEPGVDLSSSEHKALVGCLHTLIQRPVGGTLPAGAAALRRACEEVAAGAAGLPPTVAARLGYPAAPADGPGDGDAAAWRVGMDESADACTVAQAKALLRAGLSASDATQQPQLPLGYTDIVGLIQPVMLQPAEQQPGSAAQQPASAADQQQGQGTQSAFSKALAGRIATCVTGPALPGCTAGSDLLSLCESVGTSETVEQAMSVAEVAVAGLRHRAELVCVLLCLAQWWPQPASPWHHPANLGWSHYVMPLLATALLEAHPAATSEMWVAAVKTLRAVSPHAASELRAAGLTVHPFSKPLRDVATTAV